MDAILTSIKPLSPVLLQHGNNHIIDTFSSKSQIAIIADTKKYMLQNANQHVKTPTGFQLNNSGRIISHKPASSSYFHDLNDGEFLSDQELLEQFNFQLENSDTIISQERAGSSYSHDVTGGELLSDQELLELLSDQELLEQINFQLENSDTIISQERAGSSYSHDVTGGEFLSDQELLKPLFTSSPSQTIQHQDALLEIKFEKQPISNVAPEAGREGSSIDCLPCADAQTLRHADNTLNLKSRCPTLKAMLKESIHEGSVTENIIKWHIPASPADRHQSRCPTLRAMLKESIHEGSVTENIIKWHVPALPADRHQGQTDKSSVLDHTYCKPAKRHKK